jgi:hypothetical protein
MGKRGAYGPGSSRIGPCWVPRFAVAPDKQGSSQVLWGSALTQVFVETVPGAGGLQGVADYNGEGETHHPQSVGLGGNILCEGFPGAQTHPNCNSVLFCFGVSGERAGPSTP